MVQAVLSIEWAELYYFINKSEFFDVFKRTTYRSIQTTYLEVEDRPATLPVN